MRKKYIDLLRELALFYMIFQHAVMALLKPEENRGITLFLYDIVPLCPALFLFIAGFSITLSYEKKKISNFDFSKRIIKKGIILILCSSCLFFIEYGFQLPDIFVSSGILNTIGIMIIICTLILNIPFKGIISLLLSAVLIVSTLFLEKNGLFAVPFNYGYEPITPTIIFGFIGFFVGILLTKVKNKTKLTVSIIGMIGLIILVFYSMRYSLIDIITSYTGRYTLDRTFNIAYLPQNILKFGSIRGDILAYVWNYKMNCFFVSLGFVLILFSATYFLEELFFKHLPKYTFFAGQNAFFNYFYHLTMIALLVVVFGYNEFSTFFLLIFLASIFSTGYILPYLLKILIKKNKAL